MSANRTLAVFDFDRTITTSGSFSYWLLMIVYRRPWRLIGLAVIAFAAIAYKLKLLSRKGIKEIMLKLLVRGVPGSEIADASRRFVDRWIAGHCRPGALDVIARHRAAGDILMMATASNDIYMADMSRRLGFAHLVCTATERAPDGGLTGTIPGLNCYGGDKIPMIEQVVKQNGLSWDDSVAYSDHHTDLPLLAWAKRGVAVNPNTKLRRIAAERGFEIVDWGRPN
ncbi:MAG: HAD-IB family hydrolase [Alphaproteobacteria bacterium]|nr:HAD-IB family hydrolase [Alphaproteobacteria bacterium]